MGIRAKILSGFLILAAMLLIAGAWSIYELRNIGLSAQNMLNENYRSIDAAKGMVEALERQDSAVLLLLLGRREEGVAILKSADETFRRASATAGNNVTIPGEQAHVDAVNRGYAQYREQWMKFLAGATFKGDLDWYFREVNPTFHKAKQAVADLMNLNHQVMYRTASQVESRAHRATMPGIIAIVSAFLFSIVFTFLINLYVIDPIVRLTSGVQDYLERGRPLQVKVETEDEIARLVSSVEQLTKTAHT